MFGRLNALLIRHTEVFPPDLDNKDSMLSVTELSILVYLRSMVQFLKHNLSESNYRIPSESLNQVVFSVQFETDFGVSDRLLPLEQLFESTYLAYFLLSKFKILSDCDEYS